MEPERDAALIEYAASRPGGQRSGFDLAFSKIDAFRLEARRDLRDALAQRWATDVGPLRPLDLLGHFQTYAERLFKAAGSECAGLFRDERDFKSFLDLIQDWVIGQILPKPKTPREDMADWRAFKARTLDLTERLAHSNLEDDVRAEIEQVSADLKAGSVDDSEWTNETLNLLRALQQKQMIRLDESIAAFDKRIGGFRHSPYTLWGGDWPRIIGESLFDVVRLRQDAEMAAFWGEWLRDALHKDENRYSVEDYLNVALDRLQATVLASWWRTSAEFCNPLNAQPRRDYKTALGRNIDRLRNECGWSLDNLAAMTGLDKKLIIGHVNKGKGANPDTVKKYADAFNEKLKSTVTVEDLKR